MLPTNLKLRWLDLHRRLLRIAYKLQAVRDRVWSRRFDDLREVQLARGYDAQYVDERVGYYNKLDAKFTVQNPTPVWKEKFVRGNGKPRGRGSYYLIDLFHLLVGIDGARRESKIKLDHLFGDVTTVPPFPSIVKSRPIVGDNRNSVVLKLNSIRHYRFVNDPLSWEDKKDCAVWRGALKTNPRRRELVDLYRDHPLCDVAGAPSRKGMRYIFDNTYMEVSAQLRYKFIVSIEGCDVASNMPWILSSNSLCLAPRPKFETWLMEGRLEAGVHYVELADDFTDLPDKIKHYLAHPDEAKAIVANANRHVAPMRDAYLEDYIGRRVLMKYFALSGQGGAN